MNYSLVNDESKIGITITEVQIEQMIEALTTDLDSLRSALKDGGDSMEMVTMDSQRLETEHLILSLETLLSH